jgi:serine protease DegQ
MIFGAILLLHLIAVQAALPVSVNGQALPSLAPMVERVTPAVVNVSTRTRISASQNPLLNDPFFRKFFDIPKRSQRRQTQSLGSGVVIDAAKGFVITNFHVISKADEITVTLRDGREMKAELIGKDSEADIALLKILAKGLKAIPLANSDKLRVGDFVVAVGNPFGLGQTVTSGIVSAMGRSGLGIEGYEDFIQTDASINPGNSGGALVNLNGELVGMNTAILAPGGSGGNVGIGFAIPINMVSQIVDQLIEHGEVRRGVLGVVTQDLTEDLAQAFAIKVRKGAVISRVMSDSPAAQAGLQAGDVVIEVNGRVIKNAMDMRNAVGLIRIGQMLDIKLLRDGRKVRLKAAIKEAEQSAIAGEKLSHYLAGSIVGQLADENDSNIVHIVILEVKEGTAAWYARLRKGDEILSVNRKPVRSLEDVHKYTQNSRQLLLNVQRGTQAFFVLLK